MTLYQRRPLRVHFQPLWKQQVEAQQGLQKILYLSTFPRQLFNIKLSYQDWIIIMHRQLAAKQIIKLSTKEKTSRVHIRWRVHIHFIKHLQILFNTPATLQTVGFFFPCRIEFSFNPAGIFIGSWSPMTFHWLFCIEQS